jgi:hypothetical protein
MQTNKFRSLKEAALSVTHPNLSRLNENVEVNSMINENEELSEFVNYVSDLIEVTESHLETEFTAEEISEVTNFVLAKIGTDTLIESIEDAVGFELNEDEIHYVINTLNESV